MWRWLRTGALLFCLVAVLVHAAIFPSEAEEEILYTRADVLAVATGEVELRRAYSKRLALPQAECDEGRFKCVEDRIYGQVYSLEFSEELISPRRDGKAAPERRERGRLMVAVDLSPEGENLFEEALVAHLEGLSATSYLHPQAGMGYLRERFYQQGRAQSSLPAWVCREFDGKYSFDLLISDDGSDRISYSRSGGLAKRACGAIRDAVENVSAEVHRTMPDVRMQVRHAVQLRSVSTFKGLRWSDNLASIPDGVTFEKRSLDGKKTGGMRDRKAGVFRGHEGRFNNIERDVLIPPAALKLVEVPMWITRWSFEATRETFGAQPEVVYEVPVSIVLAVVPVADPLMAELSRTRTAIRVPEKRLVEEVIARFEGSSVLAPSLVEAAFADPEIWPAKGDWMLVSCREDGSARYGIAPFSVVAEVTNPRHACAAIVREIVE